MPIPGLPNTVKGSKKIQTQMLKEAQGSKKCNKRMCSQADSSKRKPKREVDVITFYI